ncbi:MAG: hypothetical protein EBZ58_12870 [Bacteroidetes bacterium]|nr:hypothetical protein [Bacteroidota bacterium]
MGFWKNDVPDIISLKKDEQGFITIKHSQGVFKMHENEVRDLSLVKDARSKPHDVDSVQFIGRILMLLFCGGMQNIISQLSYQRFGGKYLFEFMGGSIFWFIDNLTLKFLIWSAFIAAHLLLWFFVFYKLKHLYYCILNQKNDILLIRNASASFYFRFKNNIEIQEISQHVLEDKDSKSSRVVWGWFLVALWFCCGLVFLKKIPFWFYFTAKVFFDDLGLQNFKAYKAYRAQDLGLLQLFADGFISVVVATTIIGIVLLSILLIILFAYLPIGIAKWVLSKIGVGSTSPLDNWVFPLLSFVSFVLVWMFSIDAFQLDLISRRYALLLYIPYGVIISCIFILVVHFIRRRKNKNHEE